MIIVNNVWDLLLLIEFCRREQWLHIKKEFVKFMKDEYFTEVKIVFLCLPQLPFINNVFWE
jgi:hypothetical protein